MFRAQRSTMIHQRALFVPLLLLGMLVALVACERSVAVTDVPAQHFASLLQSLGEPSGELSGQVLFPSEYAQRSVVLHVDSTPFVTHPDGRFRIVRVPAGIHRLVVHAIGFEPLKRTVAVPKDGAVRLEALRLNVARGRVFGRLVYLDGDAAGDMPIRLEPGGVSTTTGADGIFQFVGVPGGDYVMELVDPRFYTKALRFDLPSGGARNLGVLNVFRRANADGSEITYSRSVKR